MYCHVNNGKTVYSNFIVLNWTSFENKDRRFSNLSSKTRRRNDTDVYDEWLSQFGINLKSGNFEFQPALRE